MSAGRGMSAKRDLHVRVCQLHSRGVTVAEIAARLGMTGNAIRYILAKTAGNAAPAK